MQAPKKGLEGVEKYAGIRTLWRVPCAWLVGFLLLWFVFALPSESIFINAQRSADTFDRERSYMQVVETVLTTQLDNWTDSLMVNMSANTLYEGEVSALERAADPYYVLKHHGLPLESLVDYLRNPEGEFDTAYYGRYWCGFLVPVRLLMTVMSYDGIRILNLVAQLLLFLATAFFVGKNIGKRYAVGVAVAYAALTPIVLPLSLQFSQMFYVSFAGMLVVALRQNKEPLREPYAVFLTLGVAAAYLDFLTYPIITLGLPMLVYWAGRRKAHAPDTAFQTMLWMVKLGAFWAIGYLGMWAGKALICWAFGRLDMLRSIGDSVAEHTGDMTYGLTRLQTLIKNLTAYPKRQYALLLLPTAICAALAIWQGVKTHVWRTRVLPLALLVLLPFAWMLVTSHHATVHTWITHRNIAVAFMAVYFMSCAGLRKDILFKPRASHA